MKGSDAVISFLPIFPPVAKHKTLVDAAIQAGVRVFVPSEWGNDTANPRTAELAVYKDGKTVDQAYLEEKAEKGLIEWTGLVTSVWLDAGVLAFLSSISEMLIFFGK
jgi:hypothetical protein